MSSKKQHICSTCSIPFSTATALQTHAPTCSLAASSRAARKRTAERTADTAADFTEHLTLPQLAVLFKELARRNAVLEEKVASLEKIVAAKKKRVQTDDWLNEHMIPTGGTTWWEWFRRNVRVSDDAWEQLATGDISATECVARVWRQTWTLGVKQDVPPFYAVDGNKTRDVYVFSKSKDAPEPRWRKMTANDMKRIQSLIYNQVSDKFDEWKVRKSANDVLKAMKRINDMDTTEGSDMSRLQATIYDTTKQQFRVVDLEVV